MCIYSIITTTVERLPDLSFFFIHHFSPKAFRITAPLLVLFRSRPTASFSTFELTPFPHWNLNNHPVLPQLPDPPIPSPLTKKQTQTKTTPSITRTIKPPSLAIPNIFTTPTTTTQPNLPSQWHPQETVPTIHIFQLSQLLAEQEEHSKEETREQRRYKQ